MNGEEWRYGNCPVCRTKVRSKKKGHFVCTECHGKAQRIEKSHRMKSRDMDFNMFNRYRGRIYPYSSNPSKFAEKHLAKCWTGR